MKTHSLKLLLVVLPLFAFAAADWFVQPVGENIAVSFPSKPEKLTSTVTQGPVWRLVTDSSIVLVTFVDLAELGGSTVEQVKSDFTQPGTLQSFRKGIMKSLKDARLVSEKRIEGAVFGYEVVVELNATQPIANRMMMHIHSVFVGTNQYALYYYEKQNKAQKKTREQFFGSFKVG